MNEDKRSVLFKSIPDNVGEKKDSVLRNPDKCGKIAESIGTGENAKNSFVYITLSWSFKIGLILTALVALDCWFNFQNTDKCDVLEGIKGVWGIVTPLVTLALGYAFGKSKE